MAALGRTDLGRQVEGQGRCVLLASYSSIVKVLVRYILHAALQTAGWAVGEKWRSLPYVHYLHFLRASAGLMRGPVLSAWLLDAGLPGTGHGRPLVQPQSGSVAAAVHGLLCGLPPLPYAMPPGERNQSPPVR